MPPWVYKQSRSVRERGNDTVWRPDGDSVEGSSVPAKKGTKLRTESPAEDEPNTHARLQTYAQEAALYNQTSAKVDSSQFNADVRKYERRWYSLDPNAQFRARWDIAQTVILLYISLVVPFRVGYRQTAEGGWYILDLLIDLYFYVDVVLNFYTGYPDPDDEERVVYGPSHIAKEYARTWLLIDVVACLPIDFAIRVSEGRLLCSMEPNGCPDELHIDSSGQLLRLFKLLRLFRLMKLLRLVRIARLFERYQDDLFKYLHFFSVMKLVVIMLYMGHLFGCFFHYFSVDDWRTSNELDQINDGTLTPWLTEYFGDGVTNANDVWDRYIASMYWAFTTMTTVGYGDISSVTRSERIIACFGMLVGGFVFSAVIGTIGDVVAAADLSKKAHGHKMEAVAAFIRDNQLPQEYYKEILGFFRKQHVTGYDRRALLNDMPYHLRKKILYHAYADVIRKTPLFDVDGGSGKQSDGDENASPDDHVFVTELCSRLRPVSYPSGQLIYQRGEIGRHMFILTAGRVEVLDTKHEHVLTTLAPGAYFGEGCVLGDVRRRENVRALGHVEVCQLVSHELDDLLDTYPHLHRALKQAYFKRKALLDRFEKARLEKPSLSLRRFVATEMRNRHEKEGQSGVLVAPLSDRDGSEDGDGDGENDASNEGTTNDEGTKNDDLKSRRSVDGRKSLQDASLRGVSVGASLGAFNTQLGFRLEHGRAKDPTLEFDLGDVPMGGDAENQNSNDAGRITLSRVGSQREGNTRALELKVSDMAGKQMELEGKVEETLAVVKRLEALLKAKR